MKNRRMFWQIAEKIQSLIESGLYPPGSRLPPERELAESFNVSRPTIREAIIALEVLQLVEVKTSSGVYVLDKPKNNNDAPAETISAFELTQARALVEGEAAALAALSITDEELKALAATLDAMESGIEAEKADREFHIIISKATRNKAILLAVNKFWSLRDSQPQITQAYSNVCSQSDRDRLEEHTKIYQSLKERNSQAARAAMHAHFNRLINALFEASEAQALEEVRKKTSQTRDLYSLSHLRN
ncbi:MAG: FadR/GntR family transcriptional regulator [Pseudomonadota bacterium]|uniref:GntR family transcriptional regulator n=1 Tax=Alteromonas genovensis TaxID=471225 RepID=A0A6N9TG92_9ALTE|nr:FadR/GntR family transcriptional regulator [Alteromonas genovensis]MDY6885938.1 FadR/GntR family transcriptional regulator [Pseudomonadota bacterium]NDW14559.1 GntR family transcriptional regulator [Alteromonas genovensis]